MSADLLHEAGAILYGPRWQSEIARDLGVNDRTVRRWLDGSSRVPDGIWPELHTLLKARGMAMASVRRKLPRVPVE